MTSHVRSALWTLKETFKLGSSLFTFHLIRKFIRVRNLTINMKVVKLHNLIYFIPHIDARQGCPREQLNTSDFAFF